MIIYATKETIDRYKLKMPQALLSKYRIKS